MNELGQIKVMCVFGTRPEAIKMAPLVLELKKCDKIQTIVCVTGQHREMLDQVLQVFSIVPDYNLKLMAAGQTLTDLTSRALEKLDGVMKVVEPDLVLVHGDTTTSFVGALAAFYNHIKIGHVEAGLRTYDIESPYPEEANRQFISVLSNLNFAPTEESKNNLLREGKNPSSIVVTGNTAIDALKYTVREDYHNEDLEWAKGSRLLLLTAHRRENWGQPMKDIFHGIKRLLNDFPDIKIIYPVHPNPIVHDLAYEMLGNEPRVRLVAPLDVIDFHNFMAQSYFILTDSGGVQEEAPSLGKPVLVLRDTTERPEGVEAGTLRVIGTDEDAVYDNAKELLTNENVYRSMSGAKNPYGDGFASQRIVQAILDHFDESKTIESRESSSTIKTTVVTKPENSIHGIN